MAQQSITGGDDVFVVVIGVVVVAVVVVVTSLSTLGLAIFMDETAAAVNG